MKFIKERIELRECTHIHAKEGYGATTLLRTLEKNGLGVYAEPRPLKQLVQALAGESKGSIIELKKLINLNSVLLLDDVHLITNQVKDFLDKLLNHGLVIVSAGRRNVFKLFEIELKPLSFDASVKLVNYYLKNKELAKVIASEVGGNPSLLMRAVMKARVRKNLMTVKGFKAFRKSINASVKRRDLLNPVILSVISGILISLRYFFYIQREFKTGYTFAMIAYALITLGRVNKLRR